MVKKSLYELIEENPRFYRRKNYYFQKMYSIFSKSGYEESKAERIIRKLVREVSMYCANRGLNYSRMEKEKATKKLVMEFKKSSDLH